MELLEGAGDGEAGIADAHVFEIGRHRAEGETLGDPAFGEDRRNEPAGMTLTQVVQADVEFPRGAPEGRRESTGHVVVIDHEHAEPFAG